MKQDSLDRNISTLLFKQKRWHIMERFLGSVLSMEKKDSEFLYLENCALDEHSVCQFPYL